VVHGCGSYSFTNLWRHEISNCVLSIEETVGVVRPKTYGGFHGDVSKHYLPDFEKQVRDKQLQDSRLQQWIHYREKKMKEYIKKRHYAYRTKQILQDKREQN